MNLNPKPFRLLPCIAFVLGTILLGAGITLALVSLAIYLKGQGL